MDSNTFENKYQINPSLHANQKAKISQRIPSKLLRYKFEMKAKEVRKKKIIGTGCHFSTSFAKNEMCKSLKDFKKVKAIKSFHYESPTRPQFIADPIEKSTLKKLGVFSRLQKLRITYGKSSHIYFKSFKNIARGVKRITNLKEFQLCLPPSNRDGGDHQLVILGNSLRRLAKLEKIFLNFDLTHLITTNGLEYLTQSLQRLTSLKTLSLSLKRINNIGDETLYRISQHIMEYPALENISLIFYRNCAIGDLGLQYLSDGLKHLTKLKSLKLGFRACDQISDVGVEKLFRGLQKLERIWINFRGCDRISDASPRSFGEKFQEFKSLKKLTIKFRGCDKITDQGMTELMKGIRTISTNGGCLEDLTLIFSGCRKLTFEGLWQIWYALQETSSLKNVQLGLKSCQNFKEDIIKQMVEDLKKVNPGLKLTLVANDIQFWQGVSF